MLGRIGDKENGINGMNCYDNCSKAIDLRSPGSMFTSLSTLCCQEVDKHCLQNKPFMKMGVKWGRGGTGLLLQEEQDNG